MKMSRTDLYATADQREGDLAVETRSVPGLPEMTRVYLGQYIHAGPKGVAGRRVVLVMTEAQAALVGSKVLAQVPLSFWQHNPAIREEVLKIAQFIQMARG